MKLRSLIPVLLLLACGGPPAGGARYEVSFQGTWTASSHPTDYPTGGALDPNGAHFSGIIGASHDASYTLFAEGTLATPGLITLSHTGAHEGLESEIDAAIANHHALQRFGTGIFLDVNTAQTATFDLSAEQPLVSLATMVAPSPDWFTGVSALDLRDAQGAWKESVVVDGFAYDSGAFEGSTYKAPAQETSPQQPVAINTAPPFVVGGSTRPVARITFTRKP